VVSRGVTVHETVTPSFFGDTLFVTLRIEQKLDQQLQIYVNKKYEVIKQHVARVRLVQGTLELPPAPSSNPIPYCLA
jgi:hypothetical protein